MSTNKLSLLLAAALVATLATACGGTVEDPNTTADVNEPAPTDGSGEETPVEGSGEETPDDFPTEQDIAMCDEACAEEFGSECAPLAQLRSFRYSEGSGQALTAGGFPCMDPPVEEDPCEGLYVIETGGGWTCPSTTDIVNIQFTVEASNGECLLDTGFGRPRTENEYRFDPSKPNELEYDLYLEGEFISCHR